MKKEAIIPPSVDVAFVTKRPTALVEQVGWPSALVMPHGAPCVEAPQTSQPNGEEPCPALAAAAWSAQQTSPSLLS